MYPLPVLSPQQSADWDRRAESAGIALATLMDAAGRAVAQVLARRHPERLAGGVVVAAGAGNNGGDGWVAARALHRLGVPVFVAPVPGELSALNRQVRAAAEAEGVRVVEPDGPWPATALGVDAMLGTGAKGLLRPPMRGLADRLNDLAIPILAVDGPTGIDLASGVSAGASVTAQTTVTFGGLRRGHLLAREDCGDVIVADIGHPAPDPAWPVLFTDLEAARTQGRLGARDHKGDRGRIVVVGGDTGMTGALRMACRAAFGAGAGLVHAVAPADTVAALVAAEPDVQTLSHQLSGGIDGPFRQLVDGSDVLVVGPGLGKGEGRAEFVLALARSARGVVIDADALNALAGRVSALREAARDRAVILTPHPGEFRRLFPDLAGTAEFDPWLAAASAAEASGCTVVLKGSPTVVAGAHGAVTTIASGNPGLATGGSGDILSGLMGAMLAHVQQPVAAAAVAAQALGRAGDLAARRHTARAVRPMDVVQAIPDLWRAWEAARQLPPAASPPILLELPAPQRW